MPYAVEVAVKWLYDNDKSLKMPFKANLLTFIFNQLFTDTVILNAQESLRYVVKLGNLDAHTGQSIE